MGKKAALQNERTLIEMSDRNRTRGLHQGTVNHKPDCQCPPCTRVRAGQAEAYLKTVRAALDCNDDSQLAERAQKLQSDLDVLKAERTGYETGRRDIQTRLEKALLDLKESQQTSLSLQQDLESTVLERDGLHDSLTETRKQLTNTQATLRLSDASIESLKQGSEELGREVDALTDEVGRLTPLLPFWARIAFAGLAIFFLAYFSHRVGFDAAMVLRGGAR